MGIRHIHFEIPYSPRLLLEQFGDFVMFSARAVGASFQRPVRVRMMLQQFYLIGVKSMGVAMLTALFVGMVIVLQAGTQLAAFNATLYAAGGAGKALTQVMIPIFTALVVGARTAASIAAELGTMRVTEQIDALEIMDVNPSRYLIVPRVVACTLMLPLIVLYGMIIGLAGGMLMGIVGLHMSPRHYITITLQWLTLSDVLMGLFKTFFFGAAIGLCGCYFGFKSGGGAEGVGKATTNAVVATMVCLILLEFILTNWLLFFIGPSM